MAKSFDLWYLVMPGHWGGAGSGAEGAGKPRPCCRQLGGTASQQRATQENHIKALLDPNFQVSKPHILLNTFIFIKKKKKPEKNAALSFQWLVIADTLTGKMFFLIETDFFVSFKCLQIDKTRRLKPSTAITGLLCWCHSEKMNSRFFCYMFCNMQTPEIPKSKYSIVLFAMKRYSILT